jgi:hypothetical protein
MGSRYSAFDPIPSNWLTMNGALETVLADAAQEVIDIILWIVLMSVPLLEAVFVHLFACHKIIGVTHALADDG